jgi:hypothetical protein
MFAEERLDAAVEEAVRQARARAPRGPLAADGVSRLVYTDGMSEVFVHLE